MSFVTFQNNVILLGLLAVPLIIYFYVHALKKKKAAALKFSAVGLIKESAQKKIFEVRKHIQFILLAFAIGLMIIGFSDPHIPLQQTKEGVNVVLALDVSGSMKATDYRPTRLEAAKNSAEILINSLKPNDNVGIVLFESGASTSSFLTPFKEKAIEKLRGIASRDGSTALGDGLALAVDMASSIPNKKKIVILLSDGVANAGAISAQEAAVFAKSSKVQVYTIGMGSEKPVVLGYDWFGNPQYAELDEAALKLMAETTDGKYYKSVDDTTLDNIYDTISNDIKREKEPTSIKDWFFWSSLIILLLLLYINYGRYRIIN
jgi:Ca-activated chloride channel homolog